MVNSIDSSITLPHSFLDRPPNNQLITSLIDSQAPTTLRWDQKLIKKIEKFEVLLEAKIPNHFIQIKIDHLANWIQSKFETLKKFNIWLDSNGVSDWYKKLAIFLVKLPCRAVRNIINGLYQIIASALNGVAHPLKALTSAAKLLVKFTESLAHEETYTRIGAGIIGGSLGQSATGNFFSVIGFAIGGSLMLGGLGVSALKLACYKHCKDAKKENNTLNNVYDQLEKLPETMLTGFIIGLTIGGVLKKVNKQNHPEQKLRNETNEIQQIRSESLAIYRSSVGSIELVNRVMELLKDPNLAVDPAKMLELQILLKQLPQ